MKKYFVIAFIFMACIAQAQHKSFQFGIKAGGNLGWFATNAEGYSSKGSHPGGSWGLITDILINENYAFSTGLDVLYLNGKLKYPDTQTSNNGTTLLDGEMERYFRTRYIQIPLVITMKTNEIGQVRYFGQIGAGLGILIAAKGDEVFTSKYGIPFPKETRNIYDEMAFYRTSFILGAGIEFPLFQSTYLRTGIKYDNCFLDVFKGNNARYPSVKNQALNQFFELNIAIIF